MWSTFAVSWWSICPHQKNLYLIVWFDIYIFDYSNTLLCLPSWWSGLLTCETRQSYIKQPITWLWHGWWGKHDVIYDIALFVWDYYMHYSTFLIEHCFTICTKNIFIFYCISCGTVKVLIFLVFLLCFYIGCVTGH